MQDIEEALIKRDIKRQKLAEAKNVPGLVARVNEMNSTALRRRTKMMLPAPQVRNVLIAGTSCGRCCHVAASLQLWKWPCTCLLTMVVVAAGNSCTLSVSGAGK